jgi:16S rRNA (uracil1498-N3)-methyltransferase
MESFKRRATRLFLERDLGGDKLVLDEREAHYLAHVLRLRRGDTLVAFNGRGAERRATIGSLQRRGASLELSAPLDPLPESKLALTLAQAVTKADAMDLVVQKATELGVRTIVPVYTDFSVVRLDGERAHRRLDHWRKIACSACEQSGRHRPPEIAAPDSLGAALERLPAASTRVALDPDSARTLEGVAAPPSVVMAVGPEGGFGATDWRHLDAAGFARTRLGPRILRSETAALVACAAAQLLWGDL